ncbi:MAG: hypothetical protein AAGI01_13315 [Myxococcota bacterium]
MPPRSAGSDTSEACAAPPGVAALSRAAEPEVAAAAPTVRPSFEAMSSSARVSMSAGVDPWGAGAREALGERRAILEALAEDDALDEDLLALAGTYERLGRTAAAQGQATEAEAFFQEGLAAADAHREATGTPVSGERVRLVRAWAELALFGGGQPTGALRRALSATYAELAALGNPRFRETAFTFEVYLTMLRLPG